jgi:hypothetical protein
MSDFSMPKTGTWEERGGWVVLQLMNDLDLKMENAAGLVGGLGGESGGFEALQETRPTIPGSKGGRGWAQWTGYATNNHRRKDFEDWCATNSLDPDSDEGNYKFLVHELLTTEKGALEKIRAAPRLAEATRAAHIYYERSGDQSWTETNRRLDWAQRALNGAKKHLSIPSKTQPAPVPEPSSRTFSIDDITPEMLKSAVMTIQNLLRLGGYYDGPIDGLLGELTFNAAIALQRKGRK